MEILQLILDNKKDIIEIFAYIVLIASIIVKITPTLDDDNWLKPYIKFIGKFLALDKYSPKGK